MERGLIIIKPHKLVLKNFISYQNEVIDFTQIKSPTLICGNNGNGKSSLIDAITTALYCRARCSDSRGAGIDDLINKTAKEFVIDFTFFMDNHKYQIIRTKSRTSHKLNFFIDDQNQSSSLKETQQKILDTIKIDYNTFIDTVCISQGGSSSFMEKSAKERKEVFAQILNLEDYDNLEKFARDLRKNLVTQCESLQTEQQSLQDKITYKSEYQEKLAQYLNTLKQIDINPLQLQLEALTSKKSKIDAIKSKNQLILNQRNQLTSIITKYKNNIANYQKQLDNIILIDIKQLQDSTEKLNIEITKLANEINTLNEQYNCQYAQLEIIKSELQKLRDKKHNIMEYNQAECQFCGHQLTEEYKKQYISELNTRGQELFIQYTQLKTTVENLKSEIQAKQLAYNQMQKELNSTNLQIQQAKNNQDNYTRLNQSIEEIKQECNQVQESLNENLLEEIIEVESIDENQIAKLKQQIANLQEQQNIYTSKIAILQDRLKQIEQYEITLIDLNQKIAELNLTIEDYKSLINAFSKSGIQSYIIENTLPEIEAEINILLKDLTNGQISINFALQKQTKSKTIIDTLDILVNEGNISRTYETFSGGEKFRIDFACHVGLSRFLAKRANASIDLFILDENLGSQDETAKELFIQYIAKLNQYFKQILIITHINDIKDVFENKLLVKKDATGSHVYII